jgi:hypothetical protein
MDKLQIPRQDLERMLEENIADSKYWADRNNSAMAEWHDGRASLIRLILSVWG